MIPGQQLGLQGLASLDAGGGPTPQGAPPSVANPGGLNPAFDQAMEGYNVAVDTLDQLARDLKSIDGTEAAQVQMMAAKLAQMREKRISTLQQAQQTMQGVAGGNVMPGMGGR